MSIELIGPQGYEYQYLATAFLALSNLEKNNIRLVVEKQGGEDAELTFFNGNEEITIEIQVKSSHNDLTLEELTLWLSHFPDRSSENNLIDRLKDDSCRYALFITRARGTDSVRPFLTRDISLNNNAFNNDLLNGIVDCLKENKEEESKLKQERKNHCSEQAKYFKKHKKLLRQITKRSLVWENMEDTVLTNKCLDLLNKEYSVPFNKTKIVLLEIMELVKKARNEREDVITVIKELIDRYSAEKIQLNPINVEREGIKDLEEVLEERNVLLLTGISFCGKTHLAKRIAREFQGSGYNCLIESDLKEATRFLMKNSVEERLCIIEDPFGQIDLEDNYYELWSSLTDLVSKLSINRKLIVTSKKELIRKIHGIEDPMVWMIEGNAWFDLTVKDHNFIKDIWSAYCLEKGVSDDVARLVSGGISELPKENLLQPGQLKHLAFQENSVLKQKEFGELIELATVDAQKIGMYFNTRSEDFKKVLIALGLGSTTSQPINTNEITFILSDSGSRPSIIELEKGYKVMTFHGKASTPSFPSYEISTELPNSILEHLDDLENRGYITIIGDNILFSHPTYYEAARYVINRQSRLGIQLIYDILLKGVACLKSTTAFLITKQFKKIFINYSTNKEFQGNIILLAKNSLNSIFPSVRDAAILFLLTILEDLSIELQQVVYNYIKSEDIQNKRLLWQDGEPWIVITEEVSFMDFLEELLSYQSGNDVVNIAHKLIHPSESRTVNSEEAWKVISDDFSFNDRHKDLRLVNQLLSYKESFIRAKTAFKIAECFSEGNSDTTKVIFRDEHPSVIYQSIRGALSGWKNLTGDNQKLLLDYMKEAMTNKVVVAISSRFIIDFGDEYGKDHVDWSKLDEEQKRELWKVWSQLFPLFLQNIPHKFVSVNESHLFNTVRRSVRYIESVEVLNIAESWLNWIERNLHNRLLQESGYAVSDIILSKTNPIERQSVSERILDQEDTNFITVALAEYINNWNKLSEKEKKKILLSLSGERDDVRWLRAVCLTRTKVPPEILVLLLGNEKIFEEDINKIISVFPPDLLTDCLRVYVGKPHPLWWLGYHHARATKWPMILLGILENPHHPSFKVALDEFIDKFIEGYYQESLRERVLELWKKLVTSNKRDLIDLLYNELEKKCITFNGPDCEDLWKVFFDNINVDTKDHYLTKITGVVEAFTYFNEIHEVFGNDIFYREILPKLPIDNTILKIIIIYKQLSEGIDDKQKAYNLVLNIYTIDLPKLQLTNNIVEKFFEDLEREQKSELLELIENANNQINNKGRMRKDQFDDHYELENWVSLYKRE
ncbi:nSTAND3 domain-containing NTPase [Alkalihalophilus marmarensis]|uniref:nSTAND3 domain-containing NTPase n=1 Tax=Alkalihalophilus marmarensis TaxID=521377 RepID=UPI002DBC5FEF|nr:hypothetical protein [Alkalihalophilus marmarensis]MEC2072493.1 hypothetical protein [Alkalihalophilus marmarensis]